MLTELSIRNFALIERLELSFGPGLNILTGETGAGKSILVGAINLLLGSRASTDLIRQGADEAEVQALFRPAGSEAVRQRLEELGLPAQEEVLFRRVLPRTGRNRIYINGALATLAQLTALGADMVSVSGQHEHQKLLDPDRQLLFLDQFGGLTGRRDKMTAAYTEMSRLMEEAAALSRRLGQAKDKAELYEFQAQEIEAALLRPGEDEELEEEKSLLRNAEKIYALVRQGYDRLYGEAGAAIEALNAVRTDLNRAAQMDGRLSAVVTQMEEAYHQLDDAAHFLRGHLDQLTFDPARLEEMEERLALLSRLKRKYGPTLEEVLDFGRRAAGDLGKVSEMEARLRELEQEVSAAKAGVRGLASELRTARQEAAVKMAPAVAAQLHSLGMPAAQFSVSFNDISPESKPGPLGFDEVEFMISPNVGEELKPLSRIASGGELSRTMLALKSLLAGQDKIQTIIFDEVDAGIGGAVAEVIGRKIKDLSEYHQVLCVTHLPQIAAFSRHHYLVFKEVRQNRTLTGIRPLRPQDKTEEIARMLGGIEPTDKTRAAAREMVARSEK
ncbi:MAG: DNA repair protein RecN [Pseudomonadota bacterium]